MRTAMFLTLILLLSTTASAFSTTSIVQGTEPVVYGDIVAFLTLEDFIDQDLNSDGDQADRVLQYYDTRTEKVTNTGKEARQPALFGKILAFTDDTRILRLYTIDDNKVIETNVRGASPSLYAKTVALTTAEEDIGIDLTGDEDTRDTVIRQYDTGSEVATNTNAVGENPVLLDDFLIFTTREDALEADLNNDGDRDDTIIRAMDIDTNQIVNTRVTGTNPVGYKHETIIITDDKKFWTLNIPNSEKQPTGVSGNDPSLYQDMLVYERDGTLMLYRLSTGVEKSLGIMGKYPALFDHPLGFVAHNKTIAVPKGEDPDNDYVPDFADNCPDQANENQADADKDGLGDVCDDTPLPEEKKPEPVAPQATAHVTEPPIEPVFTTQAEPETPPAPVERKAIPDTLALQKEKDDREPTYWFLIAVGLMVIGVLLYFFMPRWLHKRRKSFGF